MDPNWSRTAQTLCYYFSSNLCVYYLHQKVAQNYDILIIYNFNTLCVRAMSISSENRILIVISRQWQLYDADVT